MADIKEYIKKLQDGTVSVEEQQLAISKIEETIKIAKQKRDEAVGQKADMVVEALRQIENRLNDKYEELLRTPAMVGEQGPQGPAGKDGKDGKDGLNGRDGVDGKDGKDGVDGKDGISVVDASVDFDGSLVITLSDGNQIDAGQIFSPEVAQTIQIFRGGGGGGGAALPDQTGNAGKYLTTNGSTLSWEAGDGSGTVTSVAMSVPTGLTVSGSPITTAGTLAVSYAAGYAIPTTAKQTEWDTAYGWGNHASAGYLTTAVTSATAGTGMSVSASTGAVTFTNTAPDQIVSISAGTGISTSGTYPSFTVTNTSPMVYPSAGIAVSTGSAWGTSLTAPSGAIVGTTDTQTLTNKRVTLRIGSVSSASTITPTSDTVDQYNVTALATTASFAAPSGTPTDGQKLTIRIKDSGSGQTMSWTTTSGGYRAIGVTLPLSIAASKTIYVGCIWNAADSFWDVVSVATQA